MITRNKITEIKINKDSSVGKSSGIEVKYHFTIKMNCGNYNSFNLSDIFPVVGNVEASYIDNENIKLDSDHKKELINTLKKLGNNENVTVERLWTDLPDIYIFDNEPDRSFYNFTITPDGLKQLKNLGKQIDHSFSDLDAYYYLESVITSTTNKLIDNVEEKWNNKLPKNKVGNFFKQVDSINKRFSVIGDSGLTDFENDFIEAVKKGTQERKDNTFNLDQVGFIERLERLERLEAWKKSFFFLTFFW